jgi:hypothetical protein
MVIRHGCRAALGESMQAYGDALIRVHAEWSGWLNADVRLGSLHGICWRQPHRATHAIVYAYLFCSDIVRGALPHDCHHESAPHRLLVCILKRHTIPSVYTELARRAEQQRILPSETLTDWTVRRSSTPVSAGLRSCRIQKGTS